MELLSTQLVLEQAWLSERLGGGLIALLTAARYQRKLNGRAQQLAIPAAELATTGFETTDCRWMILEGYLVHLIETTYPGDTERCFRAGDATLSSRSTFMLTATGIEFAERLLGQLHQSRSESDGKKNVAACSSAKPRWDVARQELWFEGKLVKQFRIPSPNQVTILSAFEEEGWPPKIDDFRK